MRRERYAIKTAANAANSKPKNIGISCMCSRQDLDDDSHATWGPEGAVLYYNISNL